MSFTSRLLEKWKANRVRRTVGERTSAADGYPVIQTDWGPVSESARHQAAINMALDHALRARVEEMLARQLSLPLVEGIRECRRRYPESYIGEDDNAPRK